MHIRILCLIYCLVSLTTIFAATDGPGIAITDLRCEMLTDPLGIDVVHPRLSWRLRPGKTGGHRTAYRIMVASTREKLENNEADLWDSGRVQDQNAWYVPYRGKPLHSKQQAWWKVKVWTPEGESPWSDMAYWSMGILNYAEWKSTRWIGMDKAFGWDSINQFSRLSARYLRKEIEVEKEVARARVYIMGLGMYELYINGERIGDQVLAPVPTDYTKNVKYNVYDVTAVLQPGINALGAILGNGRYFTMRQHYKPYKIKTFGFPKMAMQLDIEYTDGTREIIKTDESWKLTADGPIRTNNEYDGEEYDARREMPGWNRAGYDDSRWLNATYVQEPGGFYEAQMTPGMRVMETIDPVAIKRKGDKYILDMGQNMVGWLRIKVSGNAGDQVTLRFSESLGEDGSLYTENLRDARVTDVYTLKGDGEETWHPAFVYHGFRYVEITGFPGDPDLENFKGEVVYDAMETTGTFETSDVTLNRVFENAYWGIRGNYKGMPVDCPQRNERQPWLGDRATGAYGESFVFGNATLYAKWLDDIQKAQTDDGGIPDVAPAFWRYYGDNVTWPATYFTVADMLYSHYGDTRALEAHYPSMKKWMQYMEANYLKEGLMTKDKYGDWCVPPESLELIHSEDPARKTDGVLLATAYYVHLLRLMTKFAGVIDAPQKDLEHYQNLKEKMTTAFQQRFFDAEHNYYDNNTVTANLLPLTFGMVPENREKEVFDNIIRTIEKTNNGHISTGVIGTQFLMRTLTRYGRADLAYKLASNTTYPSWGYMVENRATTIWELWNGNTASPKMNSQNHVMLLGDLLVWYYEDLAGIKSAPGFPGFGKIIMKPAFNSGLDKVSATYNSVRGQIGSHWHKKGRKLEWQVTVPPDASAEVHLPGEEAEKVKINKKKLNSSGTDYRREQGKIIAELPPGTYTIRIDG
ncbi:alpha-rhamnosidase [Sinomicrobium pectinilyticum]|uniref:alpha-L-rhamnosidase n=1 Tax=Sinomicrobium pectinilyticum TaxID=1084421 RepID=A0A3N0ENS0_SINP1|nr:alpha-L-rhamnosidase [Sinomicrobium pectinilyticum]RNL89441.1 alpha-rhamnosidase [Sinomicrobium pectinilyticum]